MLFRSRRIKRIRFLSEDLNDTKDIVSLVTAEVLDIVGKLHTRLGHNKKENEESEKRRPKPYIPKERKKDENGEEIDTENIPSPPWAKKLYREIAKSTHPDRCVANGLGEKETEKRNEMMTQANSAMGGGKWNELIDIAIELGLIDDLPEEEEFLVAITSRETELDKELTKQKDTFFWHWYQDRKSTRLNSSHVSESRMPSSA